MLYVDSSALIKRYLQESGSKQINARIEQNTKLVLPVITSVLTYAEIHTALARKLKDRTLPVIEHHRAASRFESEWKTYLGRIELKPGVLAIVANLVKKHPLKTADAIHLASAISINRQLHAGKEKGSSLEFIFATSGQQLSRAAEKESFQVFNPEKTA